jgi:hypothetical protein
MVKLAKDLWRTFNSAQFGCFGLMFIEAKIKKRKKNSRTLLWCHDIRQNDTEKNDIQCNVMQQNDTSAT